MFEILSICNGGGYKYCRTLPIHPNANNKGLYPLHRVILENKINRLLTKNEIAHHVDGNKNNNDPENIVLMDRYNHGIEHAKYKPLITIICPNCGDVFYRLESQVIGQQKRSRLLFCSRKCSGNFFGNARTRVRRSMTS